MATDEEYLDNLLKSLNDSDTSEKSDFHLDVQDSDENSNPKDSNVFVDSSLEEEALQENSVKEAEISVSDGVEEVLLDEEDPLTESDLSIEEVPAADDSILTEEDLMAESDLPAEDALSVADNAPAEDDSSAEDILSVMDDLPAEDALLAESGLLAEDTLPVESDLSAEDALPVADYLPVEDALPAESNLPLEDYLPAEGDLSDGEALLMGDMLPAAEDLLSDENLADGAALEETLAAAEANAENDVLNDELLDDPNLLQMLENMEGSDPDLEEINSLLNKANLNEGVDDDMLALLESAEGSQEYRESGEAFDIFAEGELGELSDINMSGKAGTNHDEEGTGGKKKKKKKAGFLAKIMELLTKEADEPEPEADINVDLNPESDENAKLLAELNGDNKKKASKDKKDKKKAAKKDKKKEKPAAKEKKKNTKPKKEKKPKEKKPELPAQKPVKILNTKGLVAIVALCATLIASILILSMFLPQFAGRQEARIAFRDGNYKTVYELFYKKNLSSKEAEIYNKAKTVLRMERKLESYQNNMAMDRELEAVDALILGVKCYQGLHEADTYGVRQEVAAIYQQICSILESNYGISEEEAISLTKYDNVAYTRRLRVIVGIEPSEAEKALSSDVNADESKPEDMESEDEPVFEDVLPEEEELQ